MASPRRVVITGIGVITPLGLNLASFWDGLRLGRSAVRAIRSFDASTLPVRIGAEIDGFDARDYLEKKERKRLATMAPTFQYAAAAAQLALEDALVDRSTLDPTRLGTLFGSGTIPSNLIDMGPAAMATVPPGADRVDERLWGEKGIALVRPLWLLTYIPNMMACHVSILHNAQGPNNTITNTDVAGLLALGEAKRHIESDRADIILVGCADNKVAPISFARSCLYAPLSRRNDDPEGATRPFDRDRVGFTLGEGGAVLVVEELEHARRRNARIYAEVVGFSSTMDPKRAGPGLARAIRQSLHAAGVAPCAVDHVNTQGNATTRNDAWEAQAIASVFGPHFSVCAYKSLLGHLGAGSPLVELAASLLAMQHGLLPPSRNCPNPAADCPVHVEVEARPVAQSHFLKLSLTELGQCAAALLRKWE